VKLAEVAEQCLGKMLDAKKNKGRLLPYLRNPNVRWFEVDTSNLQMMPFEDHEDERYGLRAGDIVVCEGGEAGRAAIWDGRLPELKFQKAIHRVRPGPRLHNRYFVHRLMADHQSGRLADYFTGATIKHLTGQDLARYEFPLPPLAKQQRIAEVLDRAEALRAKRRAALAQLDTLTQAIFLDMFGDPATNPRDWPVSGLGTLCERVIDCAHATPIYSDGLTDYPCIRSSDIQNGYFDFSETKYVERSEYEKRVVRGKPQVGDVVYCREGARFGNAARITQKLSLCLGQRTMLLRPDRTAAVGEYLWAFLLTPAAYKRATRLVGGSASPHLNIRDIIAFQVPRPPMGLQREFAMRVASVEELKQAHRSSLAYSDGLFASLQHRAFHGDL
jgi:type I restriction enzyme S subunit